MFADKLDLSRMNLATELRGGRLSLPLLKGSEMVNQLVGNEGLVHDFLRLLHRQNLSNILLPPLQSQSQPSQRLQSPTELLDWLNLSNTFFMLLQNWVEHQFPKILPLNKNYVLELITLTVELLAQRDQSDRLGDLSILQQESSTCETCLLCKKPRQFVLPSSLKLHTILHHTKNDAELGAQDAWYSSVERMQATALDIYRNVHPRIKLESNQKRTCSSVGGDGLAPSKQGRTRLTNTQLEILRANFNLNNSPSDAIIADICRQTELKEKVVKHWFRNNLFKERQRSKDSPYNFSIPPTTSLNLEKYEKTGKVEVWLTAKHETERTKKEEDEEEEEGVCPKKLKGYSGSLSDPERSFATSPSSPQRERADMQSQNNGQATSPLNFSSEQHQQQAIGAKRIRTAISQTQQATLTKLYHADSNPSRRQMDAISTAVGLSKRVVQVWFQNARSRERKLGSSLTVSSSSSTTSIKPNAYKFYAKNMQSNSLDIPTVPPPINDPKEHLTLNNDPAFFGLPYPPQPPPPPPSIPCSLTSLDKFIREPTVPFTAGDTKLIPPLLFLPTEASNQNSSEFLQQLFLPNLLSQYIKTSQASFGLPPKPFIWSHFLPENAMGQTAIPASVPSNTTDCPLDLSNNPTSSASLKGLSPSPLRGDPALKVNTDWFAKGDGESLDSEDAAGDVGPHLSPTAKRDLNCQTRRNRTSISTVQSRFMQSIYAHHKTPSICECELLGQAIGLTRRVVQVWFQNQRAKEKKMARISAFSLNPATSSPATSTTSCESPRQQLLSADVLITRDNECKLCGVGIRSLSKIGEPSSEGFAGATENDKVVEHLLSGMHLARLVESCIQMDM